MLGVFIGLIFVILSFQYHKEIAKFLVENPIGTACMLFLTCSGFAYAQDGAPVNEAPAWLLDFLTYIATIPKVGPILVEIAKWLGVLASVFTALSLALTVILKIPEITARWAGASEFADKIKAFHDKIQPWLKYLSIFNVQKK